MSAGFFYFETHHPYKNIEMYQCYFVMSMRFSKIERLYLIFHDLKKNPPPRVSVLTSFFFKVNDSSECNGDVFKTCVLATVSINVLVVIVDSTR